MRSVYLVGIGVNVRLCPTVAVNGITYSNAYIAAYLVSYTRYV